MTITAETPAVGTKRVGTAITLTKEELAQVPQGRDPWAILKTVPGVVVDRTSVAGNEAGQQSVFVAKGAQPTDTMYNLDGVLYTTNVDPRHPTALTSVNQIDSNYKANHDHEVIVGIDHELIPNFAVGAAYTWRRSNDFYEWNPRIGFASADYAQNAPETAGGLTARTFSPDPVKLAASGGGRILTNRPDYHQGYNGVEVSATKRLANKWMLRAAASWMDWKEYYDGSAAFDNPTRTDLAQSNLGTGGASGPGYDGGVVAPRSYGAKRNTFFNSKWQFSANALYQLPAGLEVAAALWGRQGYPTASFLNLDAGGDGSLRTLATPLDAARYDDLWNLDLRLAKNTRLGGERQPAPHPGPLQRLQQRHRPGPGASGQLGQLRPDRRGHQSPDP